MDQGMYWLLGIAVVVLVLTVYAIGEAITAVAKAGKRKALEKRLNDPLTEEHSEAA